MHDIRPSTAEFHPPAPGHEHWRRRSFHDGAGGSQLHRLGPPFAAVGIRQSATPHLQAKLTVSHPGDGAEREADRVADAVMRMAATQPFIGRKDDAGVQRACDACAQQESEERVARAAGEDEELDRAVAAGEDEELDRAVATGTEDEELDRAVATGAEDEEIDRAVDGAAEQEDEQVLAAPRADGVPAVTPALEASIRNVRGSGVPLAPETRTFFEPRMGADLSNVRVSTGTQASGVARKLNARAFTVGNHITFGAGQYQPASNDGKRLIAHELTHVIQQGGASALPRTGTSER
jgi:hypothetical protein